MEPNMGCSSPRWVTSGKREGMGAVLKAKTRLKTKKRGNFSSGGVSREYFYHAGAKKLGGFLQRSLYGKVGRVKHFTSLLGVSPFKRFEEPAEGRMGNVRGVKDIPMDVSFGFQKSLILRWAIERGTWRRRPTEQTGDDGDDFKLWPRKGSRGKF